MNTEEKQILIKDLCARLPYGVKILDIPANVVGNIFLVSTTNIVEYESADKTNDDTGCQTLYNIKPYLRPMSSMTEEEWKEFSIFIGKTETYVQQVCLDADSIANPIVGGFQCVYWGLFDKCIDWLNKKMFDYRGLIPLGLAIEAKEGMYKNE